VKGRKRQVDQEMIERIYGMWVDRTPTKVIAIEVGLSYTSVYRVLKKMHLVG
jgi:hypothetical protein